MEGINIWEGTGGETGIRTLGGLAPTTVFETAPFDHSGTSPHLGWFEAARSSHLANALQDEKYGIFAGRSP